MPAEDSVVPTKDGSPQHYVSHAEASPEDAAHNRQAVENSNRWVAAKQGVRSAQDIRDGDPDSPDADAIEEPGHMKANTSHGDIQAEPPEPEGKLRREDRRNKAAGMPAVLRSLQYVYLEQKAGLIKGTHGLLVLNQKHGIDCMSCAWPEPDDKRRIAEFCENGAKALGHEMDTKRCTPAFFKQHSVAQLSQMSDFWLEQQGRLTDPMVLREGATHYEPIDWGDAYRMIARELNKLSTPDCAAFYTSGRVSNEGAFAYQLFVRQFGTNNLPDCSNMCHESSGSALSATIGIGKGTVTLADFNKTQLIFVIGQNPGTNHPRMLTALAESKKNGAKIIAVNPLPEAGLFGFMDPQTPGGLLGIAEPLADEFVQIKINGDIAFFKGVMKHMQVLEDQNPGTVFNWDFIREKTLGLDALLEDLRLANWDDILRDCGVPRAQIEKVAEMVAANERIIACWAMGLTQQRDGVEGIQEICNMILLRGSIGKEGAGLCPVRGHSNVQGDRTMGVWERPPAALLKKLKENFDFEPPTKIGFDAVETIKAMHVGKVKVFVSMAGNFVSNAPDTLYTQEAFGQLDLGVFVITKLNRGPLVVGKQALILPTLGRSEIDRQRSGEQFISTENSMGVVELSRGRFKPASDMLRSEISIICGIAAATLGPEKTKVDWTGWAANYDLIRDAIASTIGGCQEYNRRVREDHGFYLPNLARDNEYATQTGKANFTVNGIPERHLENGQLVLMTIRSHDQFNSTIYGLHDRYRGIHDERHVLFMNREDMKARGLADRQVVDITGHFNGQKRLARYFIAIPYDIPQGNCATYYPEGNVLVPIGSAAKRSNQPTSKYVQVTVEPAATQHRAFNYDRVDGGLPAMSPA